MKSLYLICGPMGVGKTTTALALRDKLPDCAFLDGDWCWDMHPFRVTEVTKRVVLDNICHALNNFLTCGAFENVVFCWVMHQKEILAEILGRLRTEGWEVLAVALTCSPEALKERHARDVAAGRRDEESIHRALDYLPLYGALGVPCVDVSLLTPDEVAERIRAMGK